MSNIKRFPKEPTLFAQMLGVEKLGSYDPITKTYSCNIDFLNDQAVNFFRTLHGGAIMGLLDDICGITIYFCYGVNSAVTINAKTFFYKPIRPSSSIEITCQIIKEEGKEIIIEAVLESSNEMVAKMTAVWERRCK